MQMFVARGLDSGVFAPLTLAWQGPCIPCSAALSGGPAGLRVSWRPELQGIKYFKSDSYIIPFTTPVLVGWYPSRSGSTVYHGLADHHPEYDAAIVRALSMRTTWYRESTQNNLVHLSLM